MYQTPPQYHYGWGLLIVTLVLSTIGDVTFLIFYSLLPSIQKLPEMPVLVSWIVYNLVLSAGCLVFCSIFSYFGYIYGGYAVCNAQAFFSGFSLMGVLLSAALVAHMSEVHIRTGKVLEKSKIVKYQLVVFFVSIFFAVYSSLWPVHGAPIPSEVYCILDYMNPASALMLGSMLLAAAFIVSRYALLLRRVATLSQILRMHNMKGTAKQKKMRSIRIFAVLVAVFVACCVPAALFMLIDLISRRHIISPTLHIISAFTFHFSAVLVPLLAMVQSKPIRRALRQLVCCGNRLHGTVSRSTVAVHSASAVSQGGTLLATLQDPVAYQAFFEFCQTERSEENLLFWSEVENYKRAFATESDPLKHAKKIEVCFIQEPDAPLEINISAGARANICKVLQDPHHITATVFDAAQNEIFKLIDRDSFRRYMTMTSSRPERGSSAAPSNTTSHLRTEVHLHSRTVASPPPLAHHTGHSSVRGKSKSFGGPNDL